MFIPQRIKATLVLSVWACIGLILCPPAAAWADNIVWYPHDQAFEKARAENKRIFIYFKSGRCPFCDDMDRNTFSDHKVIDYMNKHFINVLVSAEKDRNLARQYRVRGYPDSRFYDEHDQQVFQFFGFQEPDVFMIFLQYVKTGSYKTMDVMEYFETLVNAKPNG